MAKKSKPRTQQPQESPLRHDQSLISLEDATHERSHDYAWVYSNFVGVNCSSFDIRLTFGEIDVAYRHKNPAVLDRISVTISPDVAKTMVFLLIKKLEQQEGMAKTAKAQTEAIVS